MTQKSECKIELLAPAGNREALEAAVRAGADAVYLGLDSFNARRGADNFTLETLREACDYAHLRGVKIYLTLNIEVLPSEVNAAMNLGRDAYLSGVDALIVQDIGIAAELHRALPEIETHISTQMNIHNLAGIEAAAQLGAKRVTLARELTLEEIDYLSQAARDFGMEVEVFAHGALCVCYSGQCLMSSLIGGRSANRGMCAQACRLPYFLYEAGSEDEIPVSGDRLLSPKDLCTIDLIPELMAAGVKSLKIEGRMKSADYVYAVTLIYRGLLNRVKNHGEGDQDFALYAAGDKSSSEVSSDEKPTALRATKRERQTLEESFSRGFTTAYLEGKRGNEIMSYGRPNNRGIFIGRVASIKQGLVEISSEEVLHPKDVLEFWTNKGHFAYTLAEDDFRGDRVFARPRDRVAKGDRVFRVRNAEESFESKPFEPRIPIRAEVDIHTGSFMRMTVETLDGRASAVAEGPLVEPARTKSISEEEVRKHISRMGQSPYSLTHLRVNLDEGVGLGFSALHHLRSEALEMLSETILAPYHGRTLPKLASYEVPRHGHRRQQAQSSGDLRVVALATNPSCARAAKRAGADAIYVPALNYKRGQAQIAGALVDAEQAGYPKKSIVVLPTVEHETLPSRRLSEKEFDAWTYLRNGDRVYADSLGAMVESKKRDLVFEVGSHVPVTNTLTLQALKTFGADMVWLSPELTLGQIADLANSSPLNLGLMVLGNQELMITEHCLLMAEGPCNEDCAHCARRRKVHYLRDRKDFDFPVVTDAIGRTHLYNGVRLDVVHLLPDLISMGLVSFMVDTTLMEAKETEIAVRRLVKARNLALETGAALPKERGTTGHLFRGVS
ncbi:MAG: DUF3656 domain-containing U32 family peptidase [Eggerthellaceae bacterium]|jgi:putative protease